MTDAKWSLDELAKVGSTDALSEMLLDAARAWDSALRVECPRTIHTTHDRMCTIAKAYAEACRVAKDGR